jgi:hypothetical protein
MKWISTMSIIKTSFYFLVVLRFELKTSLKTLLKRQKKMLAGNINYSVLRDIIKL